MDDEIRRLNEDLWSDKAIAEHLGLDWLSANSRRRALGLPDRGLGPRHVAWARRNAALAASRYGVGQFAELRWEVRRRRAAESGWPGVSSPAQVAILDALESGGAMSKSQLRAATGLPATAFDSGRSKCALYQLVDMGLVLRLGWSRPPGGGRHRVFYSLSLTAERATDVG